MKRTWLESEIDALSKQYPDTPTAALATAFGRTVRSVYQKAEALGLKKSAAYLAGESAGRIKRGMQCEAMKATQFRKGHPTWNKGVKGVVGIQEACRATQFKPGRPAHEAHNYVPIGTLRVSKDGYLERKVTDDPTIYQARRWVALHRLVWEASHGSVPPGFIVVFKPGRKTTDPEAVTADALECISRRGNMLRNAYQRYGPEVAKLIQLRGAITRQINKRAQHEQDPQ